MERRLEMTVIFYVSYVLLWAVVVFQSLVLLGIVRLVRHPASTGGSDVAVTSTGALIGEPAPSFRAVDIDGNRFDTTSLPATLNALLFVTPDCVTCMASLEELNGLRERVDGSLAVVCRGTADECRRVRELYELDDQIPVVVDSAHDVSDAFEVLGTPTAVLIGGNGRIRSYGHPMDKDDFLRLIAEGNAPALQEAG
jgi:cytochrome c biogenesis protein CcmG, thiol:disulfide interchange protein DsbE